MTTSPAIRSGIGDYTRHLLPYLLEHFEVDLYVEPGARIEGVRIADLALRSSDDLDPTQYDRVLYQLGNERNHAFMSRLIRRIGGVVVQHDWVLFDMALASFPALTRGGLKGAALAAREGGSKGLGTYLGNWRDRRRSRTKPVESPTGPLPPGELLAGWHDPDDHGRWCADFARFRVPAKGVRSVTVTGAAPAGTRFELNLLDDNGRVARKLESHQCSKAEPWGILTSKLDGLNQPVLQLDISPVQVTAEQRKHGDSRRLGCHVERIEWEDPSGAHGLDLAGPAAVPIPVVTLSKDRFELALNRSVVRQADGFIVHSDYVGDNIRRVRGSSSHVGLVPHGAERRWHDKPLDEARRELGLPESWARGFLLASFGGVQAHKRVDRVLEGLALARERRQDVHLVMVGNVCSESLDARLEAKRLGVEDAVHFAGFAPEEEVFQWLHAADAAINLRGPTSGGSSGGIFQSFAFGRPVLASNAAEQAELPASCTLRVPLGDGEVESIADHLIELAGNAERLAELQAAAREFVDTEAHWSLCAKRYAGYLASFPAHRGARGTTSAG